MAEKPSILSLNAPVGRSRPLTRLVTSYLAQRLKAVAPQVDALNDAGKTQLDASAALGIEVQTLRNYVQILGIRWKNITYRTRKTNLLP
jgi:hypothetical protein